METITVHAIYDGRAFVPIESIELPVGSRLTGRVDAPPATVEARTMPDGRPRPQTPEEWREYLDGVAGAWADFDFVEPEELPYDREESAL